MALSPGFSYDSTIDEHYIVEISNSASGYIRLATKEFGDTSSTGYHGYIINKPSIRESIDLSESKSSISNVTLTCQNNTINNISGDPKLSEEIYGGSAYYINRDVTIKSRLNDLFSDSGYNMGALDDNLTASSGDTSFQVADTSIPAIFSAGVVIKINNEQMLITSVSYTPSISVTINVQRGYNGTTIAAHTAADVYVQGADLLIYTGRLKSVAMNNDETVTLTITAKTPIDFLKIPKFTSKSGNFFPVLYGNGTAVTSTDASPTFVQYNSNRLFPVLVDTLNNEKYNCLAHQAITGDGRLHYPVKDLFNATTDRPIFTQLEDTQNNSSTNVYEGATDTNKNVLQTSLDLERSYKYRPVQRITVVSPSVGTPTNTENFYDNNDGTSSTWAVQLPQGNTTTTFEYDVEDIVKEEHTIQECKLYVKWGITNYSETPGASLLGRLEVTATYGGASSTRVVNTESGNRTAAFESPIDLLSTTTFPNANGQIPDKIEIKFVVQGALDPGDQGETAGSLTMDVYDFYLEIKTKITDDDELANSNAVRAVKQLYTGTDGFDQSWNAGNIVTNIAQMHRDLIYRFAGITAEPENYSTLNSARSSWEVFYYLNESENLLSILDQCQKEGGFIFRFKANDGSPQYIYIKNTETTDHTLTKDDIKGTKVSITEFDGLTTKRIVKYDRNPINDELLFEDTFTDTTNNPRTNYNVQSDENVITEELEMLVGGIGPANGNMGGGNKNDGYANYYNAIQGVPKILIETDIVNPSFYIIEVGDIVAMNHSNQIAAPFGESFNGKQFFVTSVTRTIGNMKIKMREI